MLVGGPGRSERGGDAGDMNRASALLMTKRRRQRQRQPPSASARGGALRGLEGRSHQAETTWDVLRGCEGERSGGLSTRGG